MDFKEANEKLPKYLKYKEKIFTDRESGEIHKIWDIQIIEFPVDSGQYDIAFYTKPKGNLVLRYREQDFINLLKELENQ